MRNILDKVQRELSVTKTMIAERELRREQQQQRQQEDSEHESTTRSRSLKGRGAPLYDSNQEQNLRGSRQLLTKDDHLQRRLLTAEEEAEDGIVDPHYSLMLDASDTMDEALPILEDSTFHDNTTTATIDDGKNGTMINTATASHQFDIGAWLLMVLVVGFAVLGIVTYRNGGNGSRRKRRRGSYRYEGVVLPSLNEEDWGAE